MKKKTAFIILGVIIVISAVLGIFFFSLNREKTAIAPNEFKTKMEDKGYSVSETAKQDLTDNDINQLYTATKNNDSYKIEFYDFSDESHAIDFYNKKAEQLKDSKGNFSTSTDTSASNHSKYTLSSNDKYQVASRINNTLIYVNVDSSSKDESKKLLKELGY